MKIIVVNNTKYEIGPYASLAYAALDGASLKGAVLRGAVMRGATLRCANLVGADLKQADLGGADLRQADLEGVDLTDADLESAYLCGTFLRDASLRGARLNGASLKGAFLKGADLSGVSLKGADLSGVNLTNANMAGVKGLAAFRITPDGAFLAYKKLASREIAVVNVPYDALRVNAYGSRKIRVSKLRVEEVSGAPNGRARTGPHYAGLLYEPDAVLVCDDFDPSPLRECSRGLHVFLTREEAEEW